MILAKAKGKKTLLQKYETKDELNAQSGCYERRKKKQQPPEGEEKSIGQERPFRRSPHVAEKKRKKGRRELTCRQEGKGRRWKELTKEIFANQKGLPTERRPYGKGKKGGKKGNLDYVEGGKGVAQSTRRYPKRGERRREEAWQRGNKKQSAGGQKKLVRAAGSRKGTPWANGKKNGAKE